MNSPVKKLPAVGRIEGLQLVLSGTSDPSSHHIEVQYTARTPQAGWAPQWHSLEIPLPDALYLLNLLEAMSRDNGFDRLRQPPSKG